jgi:DNA-binding transcriptional regulator/RsmH inhibitor MraZ
MSRGDHKAVELPFQTWVIRVDAQNRVRLPLELRDQLSWFPGELGAIDCVGMLAPAGGIQLEPRETHESTRRPFIEAIGAARPRSSESDEPWVDAARLLATSWEMTITIENRQARVTLPEPARDLLRLPGAGGTVVVFGFGEILEIWHGVKWDEYVGALARTKSSTIADAVRRLRDR